MFTLEKRSRGFTIVELLIVIVVIGILAAITIVAYNGVQARARTASVNSEMGMIKKSMLAYKAQQSELPPVGDSWNYDTNPPSCPSWTNVLSAISGSGLGTGLPQRDPWGYCFGYDDNDCNSGSTPGSPSYLTSVGPDGISGTADDISLLISSGC